MRSNAFLCINVCHNAAVYFLFLLGGITAWAAPIFSISLLPSYPLSPIMHPLSASSLSIPPFLPPPVIFNFSGLPYPSILAWILVLYPPRVLPKASLFVGKGCTWTIVESTIRRSQSGSSIKYLNISTPPNDSTDEISDKWCVLFAVSFWEVVPSRELPQ